MTVSNTTAAVTRLADGVVTSFPFSFEVSSDASSVKVAYIDASGLVVISPISYNIVLAPDLSGGSINFLTAPANGKKIYIYRENSQTQLVSVSKQQAYDPEVTENVWDKLTFLIQELSVKVARAILANPDVDPTTLISTLLQAQASAETARSGAEAAAAASAASAAEALAKQNSMLRDRGAWANGILYSPSDIFTDSGNSYITQTSHIATSIAADLSASRIRVFAQKGATGAGTGDMNNADNLSGLTNKPLAYSTIGGKAVGKVDLLPFSLVDPTMIRTETEGGIALSETSETEVPVVKAVANFARARALESMWYPYNKDSDSDSDDGLIYDNSVNGAVANIVTPDFVAGYDYRFRIDRLSHNSVGSLTLAFYLYRLTDAAYSPATAFSTSIASSSNLSGVIEVLRPRESVVGHLVLSDIYQSQTVGVVDTFVARKGFVYTSQQIKNAKFDFGAGSNIDLGRVWMDKRRSA